MSNKEFSYRIKRIHLYEKAVRALDFDVVEQEMQELLARISRESQPLKAEGWNSTVELQISLEKGLMQ